MAELLRYLSVSPAASAHELYVYFLLLLLLLLVARYILIMTTTSVETRTAAANSKAAGGKEGPPAATTGTLTAAKLENPPGEFKGTIKMSQELPSKAVLRKVADLPVLNVKNESKSFRSLLLAEQTARKTLVVFVRHFFCGNCQEYLRTLCSSISPESLLALPTPTQIVVIGCGQPDLIPFYLETTGCKFPIYADPTRKLYDLLGMTRTKALGPTPDYVQESLLSVILKSTFRGIMTGRKAWKGGDFWQVGGEFMFEADGSVSWCHRMATTRDHAEIPELRQHLGLDDERVPVRRRWSSLSPAGLGRTLSNKRHSWSRSPNRQSKEGREQSRESSVMARVTEDERVVAGAEGIRNTVEIAGGASATGHA